MATEPKSWEVSGYVHPYNERYPKVKFSGPYINIWGNPEIGDETRIGAYTEIGDGVVIGKKCIIGAYVFIPPGVVIGDHVFVGPRVTFTNDKYPPSRMEEWAFTKVEDYVGIGAAATILPGITIRKYARVGAGAVVTKDVKGGTVVAGVPARTLGSEEYGHALTKMLLDMGKDRMRAFGFPEEAIDAE